MTRAQRHPTESTSTRNERRVVTRGPCTYRSLVVADIEENVRLEPSVHCGKSDSSVSVFPEGLVPFLSCGTGLSPTVPFQGLLLYPGL